MPQYRIPTLDLSTRICLALEMLKPIPERPWGWVTEMARTYGVSRPFLYQLRDRLLEALPEALAPRKPGPKSEEQPLVIDRAWLRRAIVALSL